MNTLATHPNVRRQQPDGRLPTAFTLIELLVVVAIIALLISILLPSLSGARSSACTVACATNLRAVNGGISTYVTEYGAYPASYYWVGQFKNGSLGDLAIVLNNFGQTTPNWSSGNFDGASTIDLTDLADVLNHFGQSASGGAAAPADAVPEPATLTIGSLAAATLLLRRTRRQS